MIKIPEFKPGDLVRIYTKIIEGDKVRITPFQGVVIQTKGAGISKTFTVRKVSAGIGVERIFPFYSPMIAKIELKKKGKVRRAKLTYLRHKKTKKMKVKEVGIEAPTPEISEKPTAKKETKSEEGVVEDTPGPKSMEKV